MASRIIVSLIGALAIIQGLTPDAIPAGLVSLALVILGPGLRGSGGQC